MTRRPCYLLLLGLITGLLAFAYVSGTAAPLRSADLLGGGPAAAVAAEPAQPLQSAPPAAAPALTRPESSAQVGRPAAPSEPPARPSVAWVQAFRSTNLWASARADASSLGLMVQWAAFRAIGPYVGSRLLVEYPGDGVAKLPLRGWVETADIAPGGPPKPEFYLASGGEVSPTSGVAVPRRIVQGWPQGISAEYAALVDEASGEVLWGRDAHRPVAPASLTKIVTSLVALERSRLTERVDVRVDSRPMWESTVMGLEPGENLAMETLLYGLMLWSGNDAAIAIAEHIAGSERAFASLMNAKAAQLGLANSRFVNPHGLDAVGHEASPADLIAFSRVGMRDPTFVRLSNTKRIELEGYLLINRNRLLTTYAKADGVKVGYTDNAGRAIVGSATENGRRVYVALIRSANPTAEAETLLEWAFRGFAWP